MNRELIRRPTAMGIALVAACNTVGIAASAERLPLKREPTWSVTRKSR